MASSIAKYGLVLMLTVASAGAVQYNAGSIAEVQQRMKDAQSLDRHYGSSTPRPNNFARRSLIEGSGDAGDFASYVTQVPITKASRVSDEYAQHCPKKSGRICNNQGVCLGGKDEPKWCACYGDWFGAACHLKHCPGVIQKTGYSKNQLNSRVVFHEGTGTDGGQNSPSDFLECSGHGFCHHEARVFGRGLLHGAEDRGEAGTCECNPSFYGDDCSQHFCPVYEGRICNNQGVCNTRGHGTFHRQWEGTVSVSSTSATTGGLQGACKCNWPFFGEACEQVHCPNPRRQHIGNGVSQGNTRPEEWFHGIDYLECSGHGTCHYQTGQAAQDNWVDLEFDTNQYMRYRKQGSWGLCVCEAPWYGPDCSQRRCPSTKNGVCNNQGKCIISQSFDDGKCVCNTLYEGEACDVKKCPTANVFTCSGHGDCDEHTGLCSCETNFYGEDCSHGNGFDTDIE